MLDVQGDEGQRSQWEVFKPAQQARGVVQSWNLSEEAFGGSKKNMCWKKKKTKNKVRTIQDDEDDDRRGKLSRREGCADDLRRLDRPAAQGAALRACLQLLRRPSIRGRTSHHQQWRSRHRRGSAQRPLCVARFAHLHLLLPAPADRLQVGHAKRDPPVATSGVPSVMPSRLRAVPIFVFFALHAMSASNESGRVRNEKSRSRKRGRSRFRTCQLEVDVAGSKGQGRGQQPRFKIACLAQRLDAGGCEHVTGHQSEQGRRSLDAACLQKCGAHTYDVSPFMPRPFMSRAGALAAYSFETWQLSCGILAVHCRYGLDICWLQEPCMFAALVFAMLCSLECFVSSFVHQRTCSDVSRALYYSLCVLCHLALWKMVYVWQPACFGLSKFQDWKLVLLVGHDLYQQAFELDVKDCVFTVICKHFCEQQPGWGSDPAHPAGLLRGRCPVRVA
eukprot:TRINITY_DN1242_c0_g1_i3.p1 TRINITY_DN1242_c0_g1~~TRINITY_DN1242_c0_g1_i3.p1  ORF type:complete len:447 (+),score=17.61 TRINITY_DN1242_c0_g1_i3:431-1771(+)